VERSSGGLMVFSVVHSLKLLTELGYNSWYRCAFPILSTQLSV